MTPHIGMKRFALATVFVLLAQGCMTVSQYKAASKESKAARESYVEWQDDLANVQSWLADLPDDEFCRVNAYLSNDLVVIETSARARRDGLRRGDRIVSVNGSNPDIEDYVRTVASAGSESSVPFLVERDGGNRRNLDMTCESGDRWRRTVDAALESASTENWKACTKNAIELEQEIGYRTWATRNLVHNCDGYEKWLTGQPSASNIELDYLRMEAQYRTIGVDQFERVDIKLDHTNFLGRAQWAGRQDLAQLADTSYQQALKARTEFIRTSSPPDRSRQRPDPVASQPVESQGTCFAVDRSGLVVTNHHVIEGSTSIQAIFAGVGTVSLTPVRVSPANDLAVLQADRRLPAALSLATAPPALGEAVYTLGYPVARLFGGKLKYTNGVVSGTSGFSGESAYLQTTTTIQPGNSGGPLINGDGRVVGVMTSSAAAGYFMKATGGSIPQSINFAIKAGYLASLVSDVNASPLNASPAVSVQDAARSVCTIQASG